MIQWMVDVSHHQNLSDDQWATLVDHGCKGIGIRTHFGKTQDSRLERHLEVAAKFNLPYTFWIWLDPIEYVSAQIEPFLKICEQYRPKVAFLDVEQYWMSWAEWGAVLRKESSYMRSFPAEKLYKFYYEALLATNKWGRAHNTPVGVYSAKWFVNGYCPALGPLIRDNVQHYWNMYRYIIQDQDQDRVVSWAEFDMYRAGFQTWAQHLPRSVTSWSLWQLPEVIIQGMPNLDIDMIHPDFLPVLGGQTPTVPPPPVPTPSSSLTVLQEGLNVRSSPKVLQSNIVGQLHAGQQLDIYEIYGKDAWIEFEPGKFANVMAGDDRNITAKKE